MANIDLNRIYKPLKEKPSPVDSNIVLNHKKAVNYIYTDIKLDLETSETDESQLNANNNTNDLKRITNLECILTSLRNIFNSTYCSRLLDPEIIIDFRSYLFEPITESMAFFIGYDICQILPRYEPRIEIQGVTVIPHIEEDCYVITLSLAVPMLDTTISIKSILNKEGYVMSA